MAETKRASKLRDSEEVVILIDAKRSLVDNQTVETKPATTRVVTWFLAKSMLDAGKIDSRKVSLMGYALKDGKAGKLIDDVYGDDDDFDDDELGEVSGNLETLLDQKRTEMEKREETFRLQVEEFKANKKTFEELAAKSKVIPAEPLTPAQIKKAAKEEADAKLGSNLPGLNI